MESMDKLSSTEIAEFEDWLERKTNLRFTIHIIEGHPCEIFNKHDIPDYHPEAMCRFETNEVYVWRNASHARKAIAHECIHLTRGVSVHKPNSAAGFAEEDEIEKEAMKLVNEFTQREV